MSMPARGSVFVFQKVRGYSLLSLFAKWTLPVQGATSTLPSGLGFWSRMVIVADRGKVVCFALATPGAATWFSFQSLLLSAGPETWVSEEPEQGWPLLKVRQSVAVLEAVPSVLDGALTVAKVVICLSDIRPTPTGSWAPGRRQHLRGRGPFLEAG